MMSRVFPSIEGEAGGLVVAAGLLGLGPPAVTPSGLRARPVPSASTPLRQVTGRSGGMPFTVAA